MEARALYRLDNDDYWKVKPLIKGLDHYLGIRAVLEGDIEGMVYADDPQNPSLYFVWEISGDSSFYLEGEPKGDEFCREINSIILDDFFPIGRASKITADFTLYFFPKSWEKKVPIILENTSPRKYIRRTFEFEEKSVETVNLPERYSFSFVDKEFLGSSIAGKEHIRGWIEDPWKSSDTYFEKGFGHCVHDGKAAISWSLADYVCGNRTEIGIRTNEEYRRQGFANAVVRKNLDYCLSKGFERIGWHCWGENDASAATAMKAGFNEKCTDIVYNAWFDELDNTFLNAWHSLLEEKEYHKAGELFEKAISLRNSCDEVPGDTRFMKTERDLASRYWDAGCAWAMAGERDRAFERLFEAVEMGYGVFQETVVPNYLESLCADPRWLMLVKRMKKE